MKKKIVFILNTVQDPRCYKRIDEFLQNGYEIDAYGFSRETNVYTKSNSVSVKLLAAYPNTLNYVKRSFRIIYSLYKLFKMYRDKDVLWYYFGLDIAFFSLVLAPRHYFMYEEADLVYTYIRNGLLRKFFSKIDKIIIKRSVHTIFTSEGFAQYHFRQMPPSNISIIPNRLNPNILYLEQIEKNSIDINNVKFAFVGAVRFKSVYYFARVILEYFPNHEVHFYGNIVDNVKEQYNKLRRFPNVFFHGPFKNPDDLPSIYSKIDIVIATYDAEYENVRYAEPNKIYESIYFETPIVVTQGTFLSEKVKKLNIGYDIDPLDSHSLLEFVNGLSILSIEQKIKACRMIDKKYCININNDFFLKIMN